MQTDNKQPVGNDALLAAFDL